MKLFNHIQIKVEELELSKTFYDKIMNVLGYKVVLHEEGCVIGYGTSLHDMFELRQYKEGRLYKDGVPLLRCVHVAFNAKDKQSVDAFYKVAIENGAICNGPPGYRALYEEGYYAAFVIDLDGHNIEAVYSEKSKL